MTQAMTLKRDRLFLLPADFFDDGKPYYCPECAEVAGLLWYYPSLKETVDIRYVDYPRPRGAIVSLVGPSEQNCPLLVLAHDPPADVPPGTIVRAGAYWVIPTGRGIAAYWSALYGIGARH